MKKFFVVLTVLSFSFFSCNDVSEFLFETDQSVKIRTVDSGAIFLGGESFNLAILSGQTAVPEKYTVTIIDDAGFNWGETLVEIEDMEDVYSSSLVVPQNLPPGKYFFHIRVFENDIEIAVEEIVLFKTDHEYGINELISLPQETIVGKDVFIQASLLSPPEVDPFLRWSLDGELLQEGFLSEGLHSLHWTSGDKAGLYRIRLDIFPQRVPTGLLSSVSESVVIIVSEKAIAGVGMLQPDEDYTLLYHFAGDLSPEKPELYIHSFTGEVGAQPYGNSFLYSIGENSGLSASGPILPRSKGRLTPFSINARFSLSAIDSIGNILSLEDSEGFSLTLSAAEGGFLKLTEGSAESLSRIPFPYDVITDLTIHVIPHEDEMEIRWFFNGLPAGEEVWDRRPFPLSEEQRSLVGGNEAVKGAGLVLDELGIFTGSDDISSVDASHYERILREELGRDLVQANGFDGLNSGLDLLPGTRVSVADFYGSAKEIEFLLAYLPWEEPATWSLVIENSERREFARIPSEKLTFTDSLTGQPVQSFQLSKDLEGNMFIKSLDDGALWEEATKSLKPGQRYSLFLETSVENKSEVILDYFYIKTVTDSRLSRVAEERDEEGNLL